ncbi:Histone-lysine N-methyltransferase SETDB1-A [Geodia barretti]|uniref:Histone-lysine N-methyltransferase SETDB1-A n=2 Tax=Geodia barretti TaxID=519541 RepID=A0AA35RR29_GEOBA|nr:Histone-lysine N-methyltransferase SETDB1-A [Geodia barretti]
MVNSNGVKRVAGEERVKSDCSGCSIAMGLKEWQVSKGLNLPQSNLYVLHRGWGLRTLRDIPAGSFICTYVGQIFPEHTLENQGGSVPTPISDEYFAELDYIEVMEHHKEGYEEEVVMPSDHETTMSSEDESFILDSIASSHTRDGGTGASGSDDDANSDSSSSLSFISLCSSTVISPIHSPLAPPHSEPHPPTDDTPSNFTMSVTTPILYGLSHPPIGHRSSDRTSPGPKNRPTHALQTAPTASSKRSSRLQNEQRIRSPQDYVVPISPHQQHGIRTRQHFREDFSYIIDAKERGNIGRYINHSCSPNMFVQNVFVDTHDLRFPWVAFFARNRIKALQELTWDYSYEVGSVERKVIYCRCKAPNCRGRLL